MVFILSNYPPKRERVPIVPILSLPLCYIQVKQQYSQNDEKDTKFATAADPVSYLNPYSRNHSLLCALYVNGKTMGRSFKVKFFQDGRLKMKKKGKFVCSKDGPRSQTFAQKIGSSQTSTESGGCKFHFIQQTSITRGYGGLQDYNEERQKPNHNKCDETVMAES